MEGITVVNKQLHAIPEEFLLTIGTIKQWGNVRMMLGMEVIGRLKSYELTLKGREHDMEDHKLMFVRNRDKQKYHKLDISRVHYYNC